MIRRLSIFVLAISVVGCGTVAVRDIGSVVTTNQLKPSIEIPIDIKMVYYANSGELNRLQRFVWANEYYYETPGQNFKTALELVMPSYFESPEALKIGSQANFITTFQSRPSKSDRGKYHVELTTSLKTPDGLEILKVDTSGTLSRIMTFDENGYLDAYTLALKEAIIQVVNHLETRFSGSTSELSDSAVSLNTPEDIRLLLGDIKPSYSGSGFVVNDSGDLVTASHVVDECMFIETQQNGKQYPAMMHSQSKLLDLALLKTNFEPKQVASLSTIKVARLGQQVFTVGYPLAGILTDSPSLTQGSVSSLQGIKGSKGEFSFTAPIQPGNSGGPVVSRDGHVVGVVNSTLNQATMLKQSGTTSQNVNFGIGMDLLSKFLDKHEVKYGLSDSLSAEEAFKRTTAFSFQVLCYR